MGYYGFVAGPHVYIVDQLGLCDPLLARLPAQRPWRIGHFERSVPDGYVETLESGHNRFVDPHLALYDDKLRIATRGNLWDPQRLIEIWKLNTGAYDYLLVDYNRDHPNS
jgi:arabinofuranosyltransferase